MEYRVNRKTGDKLSVIGFGSSYIGEASYDEAQEAIRAAYDGGINYFDLAAGEARNLQYFGDALEDVRKDIMYQVHFGADYTTGTYGWTSDGDKVKRAVEWQLKQLKTDYIDYGFIHCQDALPDWEHYKEDGALKFLMDMKEQGVVKHIGLGSHTAATIQKILDEVDVDVLMFSMNPVYDYEKSESDQGSWAERQALYERCGAAGIGITVMKPFCGGQLLDEKISPFGKAMTHYQCIQYALDRPGVLTVLPGFSGKAQVEHLLGFFDATDEEKDYSFISSFKPANAQGKCVYCNHCKPCPVGLNVGLINKYYDLAVNGDAMAADHYKKLELHAGDCIQCGHCNSRCPFQVDQMARMEQIKEYFGY